MFFQVFHNKSLALYHRRILGSQVSCLFLPDDPVEAQGIRVLSYPQYCRFRSLQRRVQDGARGLGLQDPHLLALGAIRVLPSTRLMYCRDTFNHPTLETSASFSWQFSELFLHKTSILILDFWQRSNLS